jgi:hypothetical protein
MGGDMKRAVVAFLIASVVACASSNEKRESYGDGWGRSTATIQGGDHTVSEPLPPVQPKLVEGVSLEWRPTGEIGRAAVDALHAFKGKRVQVRPFVDDREDKRLIARNTEQRTVKTLNTRDDVGAWCSTRLEDVLHEATVQVVDRDPDLIVSGNVTHFMVVEKDVYRGTVSLVLTVTDGTGKALWTNTVTGEAKRWGRSYSQENYMETLSAALLRALDEFCIRYSP